MRILSMLLVLMLVGAAPIAESSSDLPVLGAPDPALLARAVELMEDTQSRMAAMLDLPTNSPPGQEIVQLMHQEMALNARGPVHAIALQFDRLTPAPGYYGEDPARLSNEACELLSEISFSHANSIYARAGGDRINRIMQLHMFGASHIYTLKQCPVGARYSVLYLFYPGPAEGEFDVFTAGFMVKDSSFVLANGFFIPSLGDAAKYIESPQALLDDIKLGMGGASDDTNAAVFAFNQAQLSALDWAKLTDPDSETYSPTDCPTNAAPPAGQQGERMD